MVKQEGGSENRRFPRVRRRMQVVFDQDRRLKAFTINLSRGGLCIASDFVTAPGTELGGAVLLPDGREANFEAVVAWARKVRALDDTNKMGLHFVIPPGEDYYAMIEDAFSSREATHSVSLAVQARREAQSSAGGVVLPDDTGRFEIEPANVAAARLSAESVRMQQHVAPAAGSERGEPERPAARAPLGWRPSPLGLVERVNAVIGDKDITGLAGGLSMVAVVDWIDRATTRTILDVLPPGASTVGVVLQLKVAHDPTLRPGARVMATAKVTNVSDDGRMLTFGVRVEEGGRTIAEAAQSRAVVERG